MWQSCEHSEVAATCVFDSWRNPWQQVGHAGKNGFPSGSWRKTGTAIFCPLCFIFLRWGCCSSERNSKKCMLLHLFGGPSYSFSPSWKSTRKPLAPYHLPLLTHSVPTPRSFHIIIELQHAWRTLFLCRANPRVDNHSKMLAAIWPCCLRLYDYSFSPISVCSPAVEWREWSLRKTICHYETTQSIVARTHRMLSERARGWRST